MFELAGAGGRAAGLGWAGLVWEGRDGTGRDGTGHDPLTSLPTTSSDEVRCSLALARLQSFHFHPFTPLYTIFLGAIFCFLKRPFNPFH
jgi:hypothetical protein